MENPCLRFREKGSITPMKSEILDTLTWDKKYKEKDWSVLVSPSLPWEEILNILWYKKQWNIYNDFLDKNVADIGSWLGWFVFEVEKSVNNINAIDPLYTSKNKTGILNVEIARAKNRIESIENHIQTIKEEIKSLNNRIINAENLSSKMIWNQKLRYDIESLYSEKIKLNSNLQKLLRNLELHNHVYYDIKKRKDLWYTNTDKLSLIGRWGENTWLPAWSQDFVFITNAINKETSNCKNILIEANRILKKDGEIIISNNDKEIDNKIIEKLNKQVHTINSIEILRLKKWDTDVFLK